MHDLDRTQLEAPDTGEFEDSGAFEFEAEPQFEGGLEGEETLGEVEEMELASEFLGIQSEAELDQFLGDLVKRISRAARKAIQSPLGKHLGGLLKGAAKKFLPLAGKVVGGAFGGPVGAALGGRLAQGAGNLLGLELEGLSREDQEFEVARQFVRFANETVQRAAAAPPNQPPDQVASAAAAAAARRHAPGLLRSSGGASFGHRRTGRWIRRGNRIVLFGV
ncbi:MAG: hypothetical protein C5B51_01735 [Terriglobia bacterium]|nr:MAG: hypothetical protein C5B51_01735 [Terriglobia bacterium]